MNIIRNWKRFVVAGCSHGEHLHPGAAYELLTFCHNYNPQFVSHLGDFVDTNALRAKGNHTEGASVDMDMEAGLDFVEKFLSYGSEYRYLFCGNHEDRIWQLQGDTRPLVAGLAKLLIKQMEDFAGRIHARMFLYNRGDMWKRMGDTLIGHGTIYSENAARDTAESLGSSCIFVHSHRLMTAAARNRSDAVGYNIGFLGDKDSMQYAKTRRQTDAWTTAFAYGEYCDNETRVHIYKCRGNDATEEIETIGQ